MKISIASAKIVAAALLALAVAGCGTAQKQDPALKVGSYNVRLQTGDKGTPNAWDERKADMVALIRKLDLDAFGLQEVCPGQADYLTNNLPQYVMVGVHRDDGVPADERDAFAPEMVPHRRGEVVPRKPSRHLLLPSLPRRRVPVQRGGDVRHERASRAHDGGEDRLGGLPRHLAERGEHLAEERFRRALHGVFCYIVRHGETPFWLFAPHIIAEIGKASPPFPPSRKFISP